MAGKRLYEAAYWRVVSTIDATKDSLAEMLPSLMVAYFDQNFGQMKKIINNHLPDGSWRWPVYDALVKERDMIYYRENLAEAQSYSLVEMLTFLKMPQLRSLINEFFLDKEKNKADMVDALQSSLSDAARSTLTERLRQDLVTEIILPGIPDYREMTQLLLNRISKISYDLERLEYLKDNARTAPLFFTWWKLDAQDRGAKLAEKCCLMFGKTYSYDDPVWDEFPCAECLGCSCYITTVPKGHEDSARCPEVFRSARKK
jgi:hypothetical protein